MNSSIKSAFAAVVFTAAVLPVALPAQSAEIMPLIDAHLHYSHDAWEGLPPKDAIAALRRARLKKAFVSSSSDDGTQMLYKVAPDLIVPVLRPYQKRGELGTWFRDPTVINMLDGRLKKGGYAGIGEFHIFGTDADGEVFRKVVQLARKYKIFLRAHSDADAVGRIFKQDPAAKYCAGIVRNHPFVDGNKRAGLLAAIVFLSFNGCRFGADESNIVVMIDALAAGNLDTGDLAGWFAGNSVSKPGV